MHNTCCLVYLDHTENVGRAVDPKKNKFQFSRVSGQWVVAHCVYAPKVFSWQRDILDATLRIKKTGELPPNFNPPFSDVGRPRNIAPVAMPTKEELLLSRQHNTRHIR